MNLSNAPATRVLPRAILRQNYASTVSLLGHGPCFYFLYLLAASNIIPSVLNGCVCVYILQGNDAFHSERFTHMMPSCPLRQLL